VKNLVIRNLAKTYFDAYAGAHVTAVCDVSLEVGESEFVSVVGPSGLRQDHYPQHDRRLHSGFRR